MIGSLGAKMLFGSSKGVAGSTLARCVRSVRDDRCPRDVRGLFLAWLHLQGRGMGHLVDIIHDLDPKTKRCYSSSLHHIPPAWKDGNASLKKRLDLSSLPQPMTFSNFVATHNQDLRRFLEEVGTDPKEARYWLRQFQRSSEPHHPFAVIHVHPEMMDDRDMLDNLASSVSFLHRNNMKCVLVHGMFLHNEKTTSPENFQEMKLTMTSHSMVLASVLEAHGVQSRPLFAGSGILQAYGSRSKGLQGEVYSVNCDPINWVMRSGHVPIIQTIGETSLGQLVAVDANEALHNIAIAMQPRKVLLVNTRGGLPDERGEVIPNINLPLDRDVTEIPWVSDELKSEMDLITKMLQQLPQQSSVVITSASTVLAELFTHHGSGTFFKIAEPLRVLQSLEDVEVKRLHSLLIRSFGKDLKDEYFNSLEEHLDKLYISERYNAAAVITKEDGLPVPYLDKFAVSSAKQGEGVADDLWLNLKHDYKSLFWRSKVGNKINNWYFKKCDGSWSNGEWIVFWYGVTSHSESVQLVDYAFSLPPSFVEGVEKAEETMNQKQKI